MVITQNDFDAMMDWLDSNKVPPCGEDGWIPTVAELSTTVFPWMFDLSKSQAPEARTRLKRLILFLYWISEANDKLPHDVKKLLTNFLTQMVEVEES